MKIVILDGCGKETSAGLLLVEMARDMGGRPVRFNLADEPLAPCLGDFECWTKTPGLCRSRDAIRGIMRAVLDADLVVFLSPVVFGGYSAELKKAVDRLIGLAHPFFHEREGLTRHQQRYDRYPGFLFIGFRERPDSETDAIFQEFAAGNAINLMASYYRAQLIAKGSPWWQDELEAALGAAMSGLGDRFPLPLPADLAEACAPDRLDWGGLAAPKTATILIGSARPKGASTSESLARELMEQLEEAGVATQLVHAIRFVKPGQLVADALAKMLASDLLVVSAPLYVDGLPSLATKALELLGERLRQGSQPLNRVVGLLNCGYPEALHNRIAMRMLRAFSQQSGLAWAGGLAMGGGEMIHGRPLRSHPWLSRHAIRALRLAGHALARGMPVPAEASQLMARPLVSPLVFRWLAKWRWRWEALGNGLSLRQLGDRPYAPSRRTITALKG